MDEPFGALDAITWATLQDELLRIWQETGKSILFATHDIEEAAYLGDRVLLPGGKPGRIVDKFELVSDRAQRRDSEDYQRSLVLRGTAPALSVHLWRACRHVLHRIERQKLLPMSMG